MLDLYKLLSEVNRPRMLISAARRGLAYYRQDRDLTRILKTVDSPGTDVERLLIAERGLEDARLAADGTYSIARHIAVLTALISEAANQKLAA